MTTCQRGRAAARRPGSGRWRAARRDRGRRGHECLVPQGSKPGVAAPAGHGVQLVQVSERRRRPGQALLDARVERGAVARGSSPGDDRQDHLGELPVPISRRREHQRCHDRVRGNARQPRARWRTTPADRPVGRAVGELLRDGRPRASSRARRAGCIRSGRAPPPPAAPAAPSASASAAAPIRRRREDRTQSARAVATELADERMPHLEVRSRPLISSSGKPCPLRATRSAGTSGVSTNSTAAPGHGGGLVARVEPVDEQIPCQSGEYSPGVGSRGRSGGFASVGCRGAPRSGAGRQSPLSNLNEIPRRTR